MAEDLCEVGVFAEVLRFKLVGADFSVDAAQVAWLPVR